MPSPWQTTWNGAGNSAWGSGKKRKTPIEILLAHANPEQRARLEAQQTAQLAGTLDTERARLNQFTGMPVEDIPDPAHPQPGLMERIFDIAQRPLRMVTAPIYNAVDDDPDSNILNGITGALSGTNKAQTGDILREANILQGDSGLEKFGRGALSFIGDVALDPLTYTGVGLVKGAVKPVAQKAMAEGIQAAQKELLKKSTKELIDEYGKAGAEKILGQKLETFGAHSFKSVEDEIRAAAERQAKDLGYTGAKKKAHVTNAVKKARVDYSIDKSGRIAQNIMDAQKDRLEFTVFGKKLQGPRATAFGEKLVEKGAHRALGATTGALIGGSFGGPMGALLGTLVGPKMQKAAAKNESIQKFLRGFSTERQLPHGMRAMAQEAQGSNFAFVQDVEKRIVERWKEAGVEPNSAADRAIFDAIEDSAEDGGEALSKLNPKERELAEFIQIQNEDWFDRMVELGVLSPDDKQAGYMYHFYRNREKAEDLGLKSAYMTKKIAGPETGRVATKRKISQKMRKVMEEHPELQGVHSARDSFVMRLYRQYEFESRASFMGDFVERFGVVAKTKAEEEAFKKAGMKLVKSPMTKQYGKKIYADAEVSDIVNGVERVFLGDPHLKDFERKLARINQMWKAGVTLPNPGHHFRNMIGDFFNIYIGSGKDALSPKNVMTGVRMSNISHGLKENVAVRVGAGKKATLTGDDLEEWYKKRGLEGGYLRSEIGSGIESGRMIRKRLSDKTNEKVSRMSEAVGYKRFRQMAEGRESIARYAHFTAVMRQELKNVRPIKTTKGKYVIPRAELERASKKAAEKVRKWNLDYNDLTDTEKRLRRTIFPFYTWLRKNLPNQLEALATRPGRVTAATAKPIEAIQQAFGLPVEEDADGLPSSKYGVFLPEWLRNRMPAVVGEEGNALAIAPQTPFMDIPNMFEGNIAKNILSEIAPIPRMAIEQATGEELHSGAPIRSQVDYLLKQIPQGNVARTARDSIISDSPEVLTGAKPGVDMERFLLSLLGTGATPVTERMQQSSLRSTEDILQEMLRKYKLQLATQGQRVPWE